MRKKFVAGNWKMYTNAASGRQLAEAVVAGLSGDDAVRVALCPPYPYLSMVAQVVSGSPVQVGAQNLYPEKEGAFTGEVSPAMVRDAGGTLVILGHSERRHKMGEDDAFINRKVHAALKEGLEVILCIGETLEEREADRTEAVLERQVTAGLQGVDAQALTRMVLAYEPVWAIGTGRNATPEQAQQAHAFVRRRIANILGKEPADRLVIQYGGSVKPDNAASLLSQPDVDGALVGGASLKPDDFLAIVRAGKL